MIEKSLMVVMFIYAVSFSVLGVQYVIADVLNIDLTNYKGEVIKTPTLSFVDQDAINQQTELIVNGTYTPVNETSFYDKVETFSTAAAAVAWNLVVILSGTYIFNFLYFMGVPEYFVAIFVILYLLLLARAIIGYIRGV